MIIQKNEGRDQIREHGERPSPIVPPSSIRSVTLEAAPGELSGPVGVMIDHLGRLGVTDAGNARVVFYALTFPGGVPVATFKFQLDTTVAVDDFPLGLAEQIGPRPAVPNQNLNDPKGRLLATDPLRRRVLRFELPELAIRDADIGELAKSGVHTVDRLPALDDALDDPSGILHGRSRAF